MSHDHCFSCPECEKHLSIPVAGVGLVCACPDCETSFKVPEAVVEFVCDGCQWELCASSELLGDHFHCPNCAADLTIPSAEAIADEETHGSHVIFCGGCNAKLDYDDAFEKDMAGQVIDCPQCGEDVKIPEIEGGPKKSDTVVARHCFRCYAEMEMQATVCPVCRTNQSTGAREGEVSDARPRRRPRRGPPPLPTVIRFKEDVFGEKHAEEEKPEAPRQSETVMNPTRAYGTKICPSCKKHVLETAVACTFCGEFLIKD